MSFWAFQYVLADSALVWLISGSRKWNFILFYSRRNKVWSGQLLAQRRRRHVGVGPGALPQIEGLPSQQMKGQQKKTCDFPKENICREGRVPCESRGECSIQCLQCLTQVSTLVGDHFRFVDLLAQCECTMEWEKAGKQQD